jgi:hypothetical protein
VIGADRLRRPPWARLAGIGLVVASLGAPSWASAKPQGPGVHGSEFVDVVPSNDLKGRQAVQVSGRGFPGGAQLAVTECLLVASGAGDCDLSTVDLGVAAAADGSFGPVRFFVSPVIRVGNRSGPVRCGTDTCSVGAGTLDGTYGGSHCIGFGGRCKPPPPGPPPTPTPTVTVPSSAPSPASKPPTAAASRSGGGSNGGLIAGIVAAAAVVAALVVLGVVRRRSRS